MCRFDICTLSVQYHDIVHLMHIQVCVHLVNIPEPGLYEIYTLAFPFDLKCESVTLLHTKAIIL